MARSSAPPRRNPDSTRSKKEGRAQNARLLRVELTAEAVVAVALKVQFGRNPAKLA
jgi:hypothetical protein